MASQYLPHPQSIRAVFFDVGFTLLSPHPSVPEIVLSVCQRLGVPIELACLEEHLPGAELALRSLVREDPRTWSDNQAIENVWNAYYTTLLSACVPQADVAALAREVTKTYELATSYALYPDVLPTLRAVKDRGLTLGVISDWGVSLGLILRHHDLVQFFDFAVVSASLRRAKPDPALFQTALQRADAIGDYALHIGDSYVLDVLGARAAGITPVLLDREGRYSAVTLDCAVVRTLYELLDLLDIPALEASGP